MKFEDWKLTRSLRKDMSLMAEHLSYHSKGKLSGIVLELISYEFARFIRTMSLHQSHKLFGNRKEYERSLGAWEALKFRDDELDRSTEGSENSVVSTKHFEVLSYNYENPSKSPFYVPAVLLRNKGRETFSRDFFICRVAVILSHFKGFSLTSTVKIFDEIRKSIQIEAYATEKLKIKEDWVAVWLDAFMPDLSNKEIGKEQSEFNRLWLIKTLHEDLVGLVHMDAETFEHPSPLSEFVINGLGSLLLYAKVEKGWSYDDRDPWKKAFNPKFSGLMPNLGPKRHPIEVGGESHAFHYLKALDPSQVKYCKLHDPQGSIRSAIRQSHST